MEPKIIRQLALPVLLIAAALSLSSRMSALEWLAAEPTASTDAKVDQSFTWPFTADGERSGALDLSACVLSAAEKPQVRVLDGDATVKVILYGCDAGATSISHNSCDEVQKLPTGSGNFGPVDLDLPNEVLFADVRESGAVGGKLKIDCRDVLNKVQSAGSWVDAVPEFDRSVPGLSVGTIGNYDTLAYILGLRSAVALPNLPQVFFSADANAGCDPVLTGPNAGTCLPAGNDTTGSGTAERPFLTPDKCETLMAFGRIQCVFDSLDAWDAAGDHTGNAEWNLPSTANCNDADAACIVWSGSDRTGGDPAVFDCLGMFGAVPFAATGLFQDQRLTREAGWFHVENIEFRNCPADTVNPPGDIFHVQAINPNATRTSTLNVTVPHMAGSSNQYYTSHNAASGGGTNQAQFVGINPFCHIIDWTQPGSQISQCVRSAGSADVILVGPVFSTSDDVAVATRQQLVQVSGVNAPGDQNATTIIAGDFRNLAASSAGIQSSAVDWTHGGHQNERTVAAIMLSSFDGFDNNASDSVFQFGAAGGVEGYVDSAYLYRNSFSRSTRAINARIVDTDNDGDGATDITGACNAFDAQTANIVEFEDVGAVTTECRSVNVSLTNSVFDETNPSTKYRIQTNTATTASEFETDSSTELCRNAPYVFDGSADTTPFGSNPESPFCRDASCQNTCAVAGVWTFPNNGEIPEYIAGARITGVSLPAPANVGR